MADTNQQPAQPPTQAQPGMGTQATPANPTGQGEDLLAFLIQLLLQQRGQQQGAGGGVQTPGTLEGVAAQNQALTGNTMGIGPAWQRMIQTPTNLRIQSRGQINGPKRSRRPMGEPGATPGAATAPTTPTTPTTPTSPTSPTTPTPAAPATPPPTGAGGISAGSPPPAPASTVAPRLGAPAGGNGGDVAGLVRDPNAVGDVNGDGRLTMEDVLISMSIRVPRSRGGMTPMQE